VRNQTGDLATQVLAPLPAAPSQDLHEFLVDSTRRSYRRAPPLPNQLNSSDQGGTCLFPLLWLPGLHGTIGALARRQRACELRGHLSNFSFGFDGRPGPRYNRFVMPLDFMG